jgi:hypothetical protein
MRLWAFVYRGPAQQNAKLQPNKELAYEISGRRDRHGHAGEPGFRSRRQWDRRRHGWQGRQGASRAARYQRRRCSRKSSVQQDGECAHLRFPRVLNCTGTQKQAPEILAWAHRPRDSRLYPPAVQLRSKPEDIEHESVALLPEFRRTDQSRVREPGLGPDTIATYLLPLTSNVIGGAEKPEPTLTFHSSSSVVSSNAAHHC